MEYYCFVLFTKKLFLKIADVAVISLILGKQLADGEIFSSIKKAYGYEVTSQHGNGFPFAVYIEQNSTWHMATFFYESFFNFINFSFCYSFWLEK